MISKIFKIVFSLILLSALFITVSSAATTVKENVQDYEDIVYIIGSTRFDADVVITAQRAANAGVNEAKRLVAIEKVDEIENLNLKTYCYNPQFDEWYEIQEKACTLNEEEVKNVEENLTIFFVNNEEKILEFNHAANKEDVNVLTDGVTFDGEKFKVPATKTEFKFIENNVEAIVETKIDKQEDEELDYGNFEIKYNPVVSFDMPAEFKIGEATEYTVSTKANSYQGTMIIGIGEISDSKVISKIEYFEVKDQKWYNMPTNGQFGIDSGFPLSDATSKFRITFNKAGVYNMTFAIKSVETGETMASVVAKANAEYNPVVSFDMPEKITVGEATEFTVSTKANKYQGTMIIGTGKISDATAIEKLEYYEVKNGEWLDMPANGQFGIDSGFPLNDATSKFRVTFKTAGNYDITFAIKNVATSEIMASAEAKANVKSKM